MHNKEIRKRNLGRQIRKEGRNREKETKEEREEREREEKKERENLVGFARVQVQRFAEELTAAGQHRRSNSDVAADQVREG